MNKKELAVKAAKQTKLSQKECMLCINAITDLIKSSVKKGEHVNLLGFGKFQLRFRAERTTLNPKTKKPMLLAATKTPAFKPFKTFKKIVNE